MHNVTRPELTGKGIAECGPGASFLGAAVELRRFRSEERYWRWPLCVAHLRRPSSYHLARQLPRAPLP